MTPEEFAEEHGLSLEEAVLILEKRKRQASQPTDRLGVARKALELAQKKTGVHPVVEGYDELVRTNDPEADIGLQRFYSRKVRSVPDEESFDD